MGHRLSIPHHVPARILAVKPSSPLSANIQELTENVSVASVIAYALAQSTKTPAVLFSVENPHECHHDVGRARIVVQTFTQTDVVTLRTLNVQDFHAVLTCLEAFRRSLQKKKELSEVDNEDNTCCICMERKPNAVLPCCHAFCEQCIAKWQKDYGPCPMCRSPASDAFMMVEDPEDGEMMLLLVSLCYVLWVATTLSFISREESRRWDYSVTVLIPAACLLAVVCTVLGRVPVAYGCAVLISFMVAYLAKDSKWYNDPQKGFLLESLVLIEVLVMSYSYRAGLSALTLGMTVLRCARSTHSSIKLFTIAIVTAIFPLLPVDVGRHTSLAVAGCIACAAYSLYMPLTKSLVNIAQTIALLLMGVVIMFADSSVGRGNGLPIEAQISMWALSLLGVVSAYTARGVHTVVVGLLIPFCGMATAYESLFVVSFAVFLREWTVHADYTKKNSIPATAVSTQAFITIGFFGFGNLASVSSFDVGCVFRYVTLFNLPLMLTLLLIKIFIPLVIVVVEMARCPSLHGNYQRALPATFKLFCIVLCCGDAMSFHFFFMLKDTGSWKDIGLSISRFVICSAEVLMLLVLAVISGPLLHTAGKRNVI